MVTPLQIEIGRRTIGTRDNKQQTTHDKADEIRARYDWFSSESFS